VIKKGGAPLALISRPEASKCRNLQSRLDTAEMRIAAVCGTVFVLTPNSPRQEKGGHS
jgi:hypothetical protein